MEIFLSWVINFSKKTLYLFYRKGFVNFIYYRVIVVTKPRSGKCVSGEGGGKFNNLVLDRETYSTE